MKRIKGLDTLRFVMALWVVFGHYGFFPRPQFAANSLLETLARGVYNNIVSGPAAVVVFFVISGFCIHFPYRHVTSIDPVSFFARRHIRILTPVIVALALARALNINLAVFNDSILWSLVCEEIYYTLYPLVLRLRASFGMRKVVVGTFVAAYLVILTNPTAGNYPSYGVMLNWLLGYPCWLLGVVLADRFDDIIARAEAVTLRQLWAWRGGALLISMVCSVLRFHSPIGYPWTLNLFAVYVYFWIQREIQVAEARGPSRLEKAGRFSYSLYLMQRHGAALWSFVAVPTLGQYIDWTLRTAWILAFCYLFYLLVERPSHALARRVHISVMDLRNKQRSAEAAEPVGDGM